MVGFKGPVSGRPLKKAHNPLPTDTAWAPAGTQGGAGRAGTHRRWVGGVLSLYAAATSARANAADGPFSAARYTHWRIEANSTGWQGLTRTRTRVPGAMM